MFMFQDFIVVHYAYMRYFYCMLASMWARVGSMAAPFIISLSEINPIYPPIIIGSLLVVSGILVLLLPETKG